MTTVSANGDAEGLYSRGPGVPGAADHAAVADRLIHAIDTVVLGKTNVVRLALVALLSEGHLLIEDAPGVGKTRLARAIAATVDGEHRRVQFTPDLLPSDLTGVNVFNQATREFDFHPGPIFGNVVVADEINRAAPKTQAALLEVMEERLVTVDGVRYAVPDPFLIVATQNPVEMDGTYRLPEAQLDRFLMRLSIGYPERDAEVAIMRGTGITGPEELAGRTDGGALARIGTAALQVHVADPIYDYILAIAHATRGHAELRLGLSPRATAALARAARVHALIRGRTYVVPEDVKVLAGPVWAHRLLLTPEAQVSGRRDVDVLASIVDATPAPRPQRTAGR